MTTSVLLRQFMNSKSTTDDMNHFKRYVKWIALGVGAIVFLVVVLLILAVFAVFQMIVRPAVSQASALIEQGQTLVEQGQTVVEQQSQHNWWSMLFPEQYQQVQSVMQQIDTAQQVIEDPAVLLQQQQLQLQEAQNAEEREL